MAAIMSVGHALSIIEIIKAVFETTPTVVLFVDNARTVVSARTGKTDEPFARPYFGFLAQELRRYDITVEWVPTADQ